MKSKSALHVQKRIQREAGLSVAEMLTVVAILGAIFTLSISAFSRSNRNDALLASASALATALRDARVQTLASVGASQYGVKIDSDRFTLFKGTLFSSSTPENTVFEFADSVRASSAISTFVFERVTGNSSASGTIDLHLSANPSVKKSVYVQMTGLVGIQ